MAHKKEGKERISDPRVDRIWEYMKEKKINLTKLAKVSGLSYPHVNNMMNGNTNNGMVYNLQGQKVGNALEGLPKGVYIKDGKKQVVK